jgi:chemotaxis signal transduction protein
VTRASEPNQPMAWCLFTSQSRPFAVQLDSVSEVVRVDRLVRLPLSPARLVGLCTLRRDVIPVFRPFSDQSETPGSSEEKTSEEKTIVLILRVARGNWGFLIDPGGVQIHQCLPEEIVRFEIGEHSKRMIQAGSLYSILDPEETWQELPTSVEFSYNLDSPKELVSRRGCHGT